MKHRNVKKEYAKRDNGKWDEVKSTEEINKPQRKRLCMKRNENQGKILL